MRKCLNSKYGEKVLDSTKKVVADALIPSSREQSKKSGIPIAAEAIGDLHVKKCKRELQKLWGLKKINDTSKNR